LLAAPRVNSGLNTAGVCAIIRHSPSC
jgi:hypothetical protein